MQGVINTCTLCLYNTPNSGATALQTLNFNTSFVKTVTYAERSRAFDGVILRASRLALPVCVSANAAMKYPLECSSACYGRILWNAADYK